MKFIVLVNQNLNKTNHERFSLGLNKVSQLKKKYWSILPLINKNLFLEYGKNEYRPKRNKNFINLKNYFELYKNLKKVKKNTFFLNQSGHYFRSSLIELIMKLRGCIILKKIEWYNISYGNDNFVKKVSRLYKFGLFFTLQKLFRSLLSLTKKYIINIFSCKPNYFIVENQNRVNELKNKKINNFIKVNSFTYSSFNREKLKKKTKNYFVFLDSQIERSFESKVLNNRHNKINQTKYWKCLDKIFDELSKKFSTNVKIAAHFRRGKNNCPIKKKFYYDQTLNLIKNSKFVVAQNSSTIDWAVLFKKPILLLNFKVFDSIALTNRDSIRFFCDKLSLESVNVDINYNFKLRKNMDSFLKIDTKKYQKFSKFQLNYKTNQFPYLNQWEILYKYFKQKNKKIC